MRTLLWIVMALTALFAAMNWPAFNAPQSLWLGFTTVTAPLGVLLLAALAVIAVLLLVEQSTALAESRRYAREIDAQTRLVRSPGRGGTIAGEREIRRTDLGTMRQFRLEQVVRIQRLIAHDGVGPIAP